MKSFRKGMMLCLLFTACSDYEQSNTVEVNQALSSQLVGNWIATTTRIEMTSFRNSDSLKIYEYSHEGFSKRTGLRPLVTGFKLDGTYSTPHYTLRDSLVGNPSGNWMIVGDTLHMMDTFPKRGLVYKYKVLISPGRLELRGKEDCDGDGKQDDLLNIKHEKID